MALTVHGAVTAPPVAPPQQPPVPQGGSSPLHPYLADVSVTGGVTNLHPATPNQIVHDLLTCCGEVESWNRMQDAKNGGMKKVGIVVFRSVEGLLRAGRLLEGVELRGQGVKVRVEEKVLSVVKKYLHQRELLEEEINERMAAAQRTVDLQIQLAVETGKPTPPPRPSDPDARRQRNIEEVELEYTPMHGEITRITDTSDGRSFEFQDGFVLVEKENGSRVEKEPANGTIIVKPPTGAPPGPTTTPIQVIDTLEVKRAKEMLKGNLPPVPFHDPFALGKTAEAQPSWEREKDEAAWLRIQTYLKVFTDSVEKERGETGEEEKREGPERSERRRERDDEREREDREKRERDERDREDRDKRDREERDIREERDRRERRDDRDRRERRREGRDDRREDRDRRERRRDEEHPEKKRHDRDDEEKNGGERDDRRERRREKDEDLDRDKRKEKKERRRRASSHSEKKDRKRRSSRDDRDRRRRRDRSDSRDHRRRRRRSE